MSVYVRTVETKSGARMGFLDLHISVKEQLRLALAICTQWRVKFWN